MSVCGKDNSNLPLTTKKCFKNRYYCDTIEQMFDSKIKIDSCDYKNQS